MKRSHLIAMSCLFLVSQVVLALTAAQGSGQYPVPLRVILALAMTLGVGLGAILVWYSVVSSPEPPSEFEHLVDESDPFYVWCQDNWAILSQYRDAHLAISPTHGIVAVGYSEDEFYRALEAAGDCPDDTVITNSAMLVSGKHLPFTVH